MKRIDESSPLTVSFEVRVQPRASRSEVVGWTSEGVLKIRVTSAPVEEGANRELVRLMSRTLDVGRGEVEIVAGAHSRTKRLTVPIACKNRLLSFSDI